MGFKDLKKHYGNLAKKYKLPSFKEMNENFEIEKIDKESSTLLRTVRKIAMEKVVNSIGFLDILLNPQNAPLMYLQYIKGMSMDDRKRIDKIYGVLSMRSIEALELEVQYNEKNEADLIKKVNKSWNELKSEFNDILSNMKNPNILEVRRERTYFG